MITAIFMVYFLGNQTTQFIPDQTIHKTMEECQLYSEALIKMQQEKVAKGLSSPHTAQYRCVNWGERA